MIYFALCFSETCRKLCLIKWSVNEFRWFYFRLTFSSFLYFLVTAPAPRDQRDDRIFSFKPASLIQLLSVSLLCVPSCVPKRKCLYLCPPTHQKSRSMLMQTADTPMAHSSIFVCAKSFFIIIYCTTELFFPLSVALKFLVISNMFQTPGHVRRQYIGTLKVNVTSARGRLKYRWELMPIFHDTICLCKTHFLIIKTLKSDCFVCRK